jgi:hypothetical protein
MLFVNILIVWRCFTSWGSSNNSKVYSIINKRSLLYSIIWLSFTHELLLIINDLWMIMIIMKILLIVWWYYTVEVIVYLIILCVVEYWLREYYLRICRVLHLIYILNWCYFFLFVALEVLAMLGFCRFLMQKLMLTNRGILFNLVEANVLSRITCWRIVLLNFIKSWKFLLVLKRWQKSLNTSCWSCHICWR